MPPSDQRVYEPEELASILGVPLAAVEEAALTGLPRSWNLTDGSWWVEAADLDEWRRYFVKPPEVPAYSTHGTLRVRSCVRSAGRCTMGRGGSRILGLADVDCLHCSRPRSRGLLIDVLPLRADLSDDLSPNPRHR